LKAATLLETLVSLVILLAVTGVTVIILTGTGRAGVSMQQMRAEQILLHYADMTREQKSFYDAADRYDEFNVKKEVHPFPGRDSLWQMHFYIYDRQMKLLDDWELLAPANE